MPAEEPLAFKAGSGWPWFGQAGETPRCTPKGKVWPRISIVTASFNQGRFIEETVRSVLCQGYPNLEYIIMDGGSTDQTLKIIEKYGPLLAYWTSGKDEGSADAMDKGFQRATGEIFALINSDDVYMPYTLELIARLFEQFPDVEWITAHSTFLVDGCVVSPRRRHVEVFNQRLMQLGFNTPSFLGIPQAISTFWRSSLYRKAGGYVNKELWHAADVDLWQRMAQHCVPVFLPATVAMMRLHAGQKSAYTSSFDEIECGRHPFLNHTARRLLYRCMKTAGLRYLLRRFAFDGLGRQFVWDFANSRWELRWTSAF